MRFHRLTFAVGAAALLCFAPRFLAGGELVVSQKNAAASDENPGTEALPLKTISAAAARVKAGEKVTIHGGDYRETVIINASGTEAAPIVFEAAAGEKPVIKGSDIVTNWAREEGSIWKARLKTPEPREPAGNKPGYWDTNNVRQVFTQDGALLDARRLRRVENRNAMEAGTFFSDPTTSELFVWLKDSGSPLERPIEVAVRGAWLCIYGSHVAVRGLAMRHSSTTAIANWPACNIYGEHNTLEDCVISWGDFAGVSLSGKSNRLLRTVVACHGACGVGGTGEGHTIEGCRVLYNNVSRYDPDWHAGGAKLGAKFNHGSIHHNEFAHNLGPGLWLDIHCDNNVIDGNFSHDNEGAGVMVEISTGNLIVNNVLAGNRNFLSGPYRGGDGSEEQVPYSERRIAPSRLLKLYHAGDGRGIYVSSSPQTKVLHNTVYRNEAEGICVEGPPREGLVTRDAQVMNNLSVFNHGAQLTLRPDSAEEKTRSRSDYNLLFSVGAVLAKHGWDGTSTFDLEEWLKISGMDQHSLDADPQFAMAAMDDFRLLPSSPVLGSGQPLPEVERDYFGQSRGREKTAIGAFEAPAINYPKPIGKASAP